MVKGIFLSFFFFSFFYGVTMVWLCGCWLWSVDSAQTQEHRNTCTLSLSLLGSLCQPAQHKAALSGTIYAPSSLPLFMNMHVYVQRACVYLVVFHQPSGLQLTVCSTIVNSCFHLSQESIRSRLSAPTPFYKQGLLSISQLPLLCCVLSEITPLL